MYERFFFPDVHVRGHYPNYGLKEWEREGYKIEMQLEDSEILKESIVDYNGFNHYMSNAVKADAKTDTSKSMEGAIQYSVSNPYVKASD